MPITEDELAILQDATLEELERRIELAEWEKIEDFELRASSKSIRFQKAFFLRADETGRRCNKFVAVGGNRSSKSVTCARLCFSKYLRDVAKNGDRFWVGSQNLDRSISGSQKEIWEALPAELFCGKVWEPKNGFGGHAKVVIHTRDGGYAAVEFRSADQELKTFESDKLRGVMWDENLPEALYNRLLPRLIDLRGFFLYSDINNQAWPIERLEEAPPEAGVYYQNFSMYDNAQNLPPGAIEEFMAGIPQEEIDLRVHGKPGAMEGVVFKQYFDHIHAVDDFIIPIEVPKWRNIDFGESAPLAVSWSAITPNEHIWVYREHYERGKSVYANAKMIHEASGAQWREVQRGKDELHEKPWTQLVAYGGEQYVKNYLDPACFGDSNGSRVTIAQQFEDCGIKCEPWPRVNQMGEHAMVAKFKYRLENKTWHVFKSCAFMRREMRIWKHKLDKDGKPVAADAYEHGNNHLVDGQKGFIAGNPTFAQPKIQVMSQHKSPIMLLGKSRNDVDDDD